MNQQSIFYLPIDQLAISFILGICLSFIYLYLLWRSVQTLPKTRHPQLFLFFSRLLRLFLLIFGMLALAQDSAGRFISIFCGVILTRLVILKFTKIQNCQKKEDTIIKNGISNKKYALSKRKNNTRKRKKWIK